MGRMLKLDLEPGRSSPVAGDQAAPDGEDSTAGKPPPAPKPHLFWRLVLPACVTLGASWVFVALWLVLAPDALRFRILRVSTGAMIPTILIGETIFADMRPGVRESIRRGDVVIFEYPVEPSKLYVKRVVALPGEILEIRDNQVFIAGKVLDEPHKVHETELSLDDWRRVREGLPAREPSAGRGEGVSATLRPLGIDIGPILVPEEHFFVMGDNRDNSKDSRAWGSVHRSAVRGRALWVLWSEPDESMDVRWHRLGKSIH